MIKKPHFYYTRLEKIALTLTHKIPFLPILDHILSHLDTTTLNPRRFPTYRCNNPKKFKKLSQGSGPQCPVNKITFLRRKLILQINTLFNGKVCKQIFCTISILKALIVLLNVMLHFHQNYIQGGQQTMTVFV